MANALPPPARIPSTEAIRRAALARSARRGARVAAWRVGLRWMLWGGGKFLVGLGALSVVAMLGWGLRWGWLHLVTPAPQPAPVAMAPATPASRPVATAPASAPMTAVASAPATASASAPAIASAPASASEPASARASFPLRMDDSDPLPAARNASAGAQSAPPRNPRPNNP